MTNCKDIYAFVSGVQARSTPPTIPPTDIQTLQQIQWIRYLTTDQFSSMAKEVEALSVDEEAFAQAQDARNRAGALLEDDTRKSHSILFHLEGQAKRDAVLQEEAQAQRSFQSADSDASARRQTVEDLIAKRSLLDTLTPGAGGYVAVTGLGAVETRRLSLGMYRFSDVDFASYWAVRQQVGRDLNDIADRGAQCVQALSTPLAKVDRSYLWSIAIGLAKRGTDLGAGMQAFLDAYNRIGGLSENEENRLMAAEILSCLPRSVGDSLPALKELDHEVRKVGVAKPSSLGVASILLLGQRADGTFATQNLPYFLRLTSSFESAALLSIVNVAPDQLAAKFAAYSSTFRSWGFQPSEDVELSSAYLSLSEVPVDGVTPKLAILARGLATYLQYPLVAAAIVASIPVLEANESLNLVEEAYDILARRAMPAAQGELICLAVRMIHGVRSETVTGLDATATAVPSTAAMGYWGGPRFLFVPIIVAHGGYYSTFSGVGGVHPGHAHVGGGFSG